MNTDIEYAKSINNGKKPTIRDIKYHTSFKAPHMFTRRTMRFFGQTMRDFKVVISPAGNIYILAPMRPDGKFTGSYTSRQYHPKTGELTLLGDDNNPCIANDKNSIMRFIASH